MDKIITVSIPKVILDITCRELCEHFTNSEQEFLRQELNSVVDNLMTSSDPVTAIIDHFDNIGIMDFDIDIEPIIDKITDLTIFQAFTILVCVKNHMKITT